MMVKGRKRREPEKIFLAGIRRVVERARKAERAFFSQSEPGLIFSEILNWDASELSDEANRAVAESYAAIVNALY